MSETPKACRFCGKRYTPAKFSKFLRDKETNSVFCEECARIIITITNLRPTISKG